MTEKRFTEIISTQKVIDNKTGKEYDCLIDNELLKLLNELDEKWIGEFSLRERLQLELQRVEEENKQLKTKVDFYKYFQKDARELEKENEQLKQEGANVEKLIDDLGSEELRRQYEEIINGDVE